MAAQVVEYDQLPNALRRLPRNGDRPVLTRVGDRIFEVYPQGAVTTVSGEEIHDIEAAAESALRLIVWSAQNKPPVTLDDMLAKYGLTRESLDGDDELDT